jgi:hypothetical protein
MCFRSRAHVAVHSRAAMGRFRFSDNGRVNQAQASWTQVAIKISLLGGNAPDFQDEIKFHGSAYFGSRQTVKPFAQFSLGLGI